MQYRETYQASASYKEDYLSGIERFLEVRQKSAESCRREYIKDIFSEPERYREALRQMLGYPLCGEKRTQPPVVSMEMLSEEEGYTIYRMRYEILDGLIMTGLLFRIKGEKKRPLVIVQHGGEGSPEAISGVYGHTSNYHDMLMRVVRHGVHAFALQLLLWTERKYGVPFDRDQLDARLKSVGSSITALEVYGIMRALDYFETLPWVGRFGMVGLSYGGFYTQYTTALDTRIVSAISCSYFNRRELCFHADWSWFGSALRFDDAELACLVYPRRLCLEVGDHDELFAVEGAREAYQRLCEYCKPVGMDWLHFIVYEGGHEFSLDDEPIETLVRDLAED